MKSAEAGTLRDWLRLLRWKNLLIIATTQGLVWACLVWPLRHDDVLVLTPASALCLIFSTVLIAAAGYLINDYFDIKIDAINRPQKSILERRVHRRRAIILHSALNLAGVFLAGAIAWRAGHAAWVLWQVSTVVLLWFYSTHFKRVFVTGNVVVALLTALTVLLFAIYEPALEASASGPAGFSSVAVLYVFAAFAFLLTWMREIVKDAEDLKGDAAEGCDTMPIRIGLLRSARFVQVLAGISILLIAYCVFECIRHGNFMPAVWLSVVILVPLGIWAIRLTRGASSAHFERASRRLKLLMLAGLVGLILISLPQP